MAVATCRPEWLKDPQRPSHVKRTTRLENSRAESPGVAEGTRVPAARDSIAGTESLLPVGAGRGGWFSLDGSGRDLNSFSLVLVFPKQSPFRRAPPSKGERTRHRTGAQVLLSTCFPFQDSEEEDLPPWLGAGGQTPQLPAPTQSRGEQERRQRWPRTVPPARAGANGARLSRPGKRVGRAASPAPFPWRDPELQTLPMPHVVRGHPGRVEMCTRMQGAEVCKYTRQTRDACSRHTHTQAHTPTFSLRMSLSGLGFAAGTWSCQC